MSKSRNTNRLAKKIRDQTPLKLSTAFRLAQQVDVHLGSGISDSPDPLQRRLEAHVASVLADSFRDDQLNGALLGVRDAEPDAQSVKLTLESEMADEVLRKLLPRFDHSYGGIRGVPGLRVREGKGRVILHDAVSSSHLTVVRADGGSFILPSARTDEVLLWKRLPGGLSRDERQEVEEWADLRGFHDLRVRDLLLSRILRCPNLVNRAAAPHGFANCYTHHAGDLVIEWCCGDTAEALCAVLLAHGFIDGVPQENTVELVSRHSVHFGNRTVILNRHASCLYGHSTTDIVASIKRGYKS
ncbi:hypothetical protein [Streptomyces sp. BBFR102]|uniref:hypothetical protein n=1 Tax=Streptomyces sp. BBFR102 TaxID=3448171 RepID=UPI003F5362EF